MTKNLNAFQNFASGFSIRDAMEQHEIERQKVGILQQDFDLRKEQEQHKIQQDERKLAQEEAKRALAMEAFNSPEALKAVYSRDRELGESIAKERDKFNRISYTAISDTLKAKPEQQQEAWDIARANLKQRGVDVSDLSAKYSPQVEIFLRGKQKDLRTWDDTFKTLETAQGIARLDEKTGEIKPTGYGVFRKADAAEKGGATGALIDRLKAENPKLTNLQALQLIQNGLRTGTSMNENGEIIVTPGLEDAKIRTKAAESEGTAFGKDTGEKKALLRSMNAKMPELESTVSNLTKLGKLATYTATGKVANEARKQLGLPASQGAVNRAEYIAVVDNQILPLLRDTFGAAFTEKEGQTLRTTLGDPDKTPAEKDASLRAFIKQKRQTIGSLEREVGNQKENKVTKTQDHSEEDIAHTAEKYRISPEEVRRRLNIK